MRFGKVIKTKKVAKGGDEQLEELKLCKAEAEFLNELAEDYNFGYVNKTVRNMIDYYIMEEGDFNRVMKESRSFGKAGEVETVYARVTTKHDHWLTEKAKKFAKGDKSLLMKIILHQLMKEEDLSYIFDTVCSARESVELYNDLITGIVVDS